MASARVKTYGEMQVKLVDLLVLIHINDIAAFSTFLYNFFFLDITANVMTPIKRR
jgi:hypothetical protein